jgi:hypothetical protein
MNNASYGSPVALELRQGQYFQFAVPQGWRVGEEGSHAVVLIAPDSAALTMLIGNTGLPLGTAPGQFIWQYLAPHYQGLALSPPRPAQPALGCQSAWEFDYQYYVNGVPCCGIVKCSVQPSYDSCTMILTAAAAQATQWQSYAAWLPRVPEQVAVTHGGAFGARGTQQQNLQSSQQLGAAYQSYRAWSQQNWAEVTQQREASQERQNFHFRENLGGVETVVDPYTARTVELPTAHTYHWVNPYGQVWSTNDPSADPNVGSTVPWQRMARYTPG